MWSTHACARGCVVSLRQMQMGGCRDLGAHVLIDDNPVYAMECAEAGLQVLLYDWQLSYPWSKTADGG